MNSIQMKYSRVEWIGDIPKNWQIKRLKDLSFSTIGITYSPNDVVDEGSPNAILVLRSSNIQNSKISFKDNVFVNLPIPKKQKTKIGDILICSRNGSRSLLGKNAFIDEESKDLTFGAFTTILRSKYNKYIKYFLKSGVFDNVLNSSTSTINQLTNRDLNNIVITLPTLQQQTAIADYLDNHTTKIDKEISLLEQKVEKLDEYKQSLIYETVTKGLDKNVQMKDSGIEWIGIIPEHWEVKRLKDITYINKGKSFSEELEIENGSFPYINGGINPSDWTDSFNAKFNTIAVSEGGASAGYSQYMNHKYWAGDHCYIVKAKNNCAIKYLFYILKGYEKNIMNEKKGSAMPNLQKTKFVNYSIPFNINKSEQRKIAEYLDSQSSKIDKKKELVNKKIKLLKEYKQSLIYEVVTGKINIEQNLEIEMDIFSFLKLNKHQTFNSLKLYYLDINYEKIKDLVVEIPNTFSFENEEPKKLNDPLLKLNEKGLSILNDIDCLLNKTISLNNQIIFDFDEYLTKLKLENVPQSTIDWFYTSLFEEQIFRIDGNIFKLDLDKLNKLIKE